MTFIRDLRFVGRTIVRAAMSLGVIPVLVLTAWLPASGQQLIGNQQTQQEAQSRSRGAARDERWGQDLTYLATQLSANQLDFASLYPKDRFDAELDSIRQDVPQLSDAEIVLRLMRLIALGGVAHNAVHYASGPQAFHPLPIRFRWCSDGLIVVRVAEEHAEGLGARVLRIGKLTPEEFETAVTPYISHENGPGVREDSTSFMVQEEVLRHFGLIDSTGGVRITVVKAGGKPLDFEIFPNESNKRPTIVDAATFLHIPSLLQRTPRANYHHQYLPDLEALYIEYNRCLDDPKLPFSDFARQVGDFIDSHPTQRVIVDLRSNGGGNSELIEPLIDVLKARPEAEAHGRLFALMGPATFSSGLIAAYRFRALHAILVGESAGQRPNFYGNTAVLQLPNSQLQVQYTRKHLRLIDDSDPEEYKPDLSVTLSIDDYLHGRDPVLDAALHHSNH